MRARTYVAWLLVGLGTLALVAGLLAGVVKREALDGDRFAAHLDSIRADDDVARVVGNAVVERLIQAEPELVALRPLLEGAASAVVGSPAFGGVFRTAVAPLHRALVSDDPDQVVLRLADVAALVVAALTELVPEVSAQVPADLDVRLSELGGQQPTRELIEVADTTALLAWLLPLVGLVLLASAGLLRPGRRSRLLAAAATIGGGLVAAAAVVAVLTLAVTAWAAAADREAARTAVWAAVWDQLDGPLWTVVVLAAALGLLVLLVADWGERNVLVDPVGAARDWLGRPAVTTRERVLRGVLVLAAGVLLLVEPLRVVALALGALGLLLLVHGVALLALALPRPAVVLGTARRIALGGLAVVLLGSVVATAWPTDRDLPPRPGDADACNGHVELCERRYDEVAYVATHNSMSAADEPGWFLAEQPTGVLGQLDDGVRAFLIDSWYGQATGREGVVATADRLREAAFAQAEAEYGRALLDSALRVRGALRLTPQGAEETFLCHAFCELGSTELEPLLRQVRSWLDLHPGEVVTFIVQDEVSPEETAAVVEAAGLAAYVHTQRPGEPWPTLREMVDSGRRVVFFMERRGGGEEHPWLLAANEWIQDTPFSFRAERDFTCAAFRGDPAAGLFLLNHWLSNPTRKIGDSARVNTPAVLGARAEQCQQERGLLPNFVAVDYYDQGDVFAVVDELNGR